MNGGRAQIARAICCGVADEGGVMGVFGCSPRTSKCNFSMYHVYLDPWGDASMAMPWEEISVGEMRRSHRGGSKLVMQVARLVLPRRNRMQWSRRFHKER